jgi:hypothetical protein
MIINTGSPLLNLILEEVLQMGRRCCVLYCSTWPLQSDYDTAWARPRFTLAQRTAGKGAGWGAAHRRQAGGVGRTPCESVGAYTQYRRGAGAG